jgi:hypothetical protein
LDVVLLVLVLFVLGLVVDAAAFALAGLAGAVFALGAPGYLNVSTAL